MNAHISGIQLGVADLNRAKQFYSEGLGWPIDIDQPYFVSFAPSSGSSALGLYPWAFLANDAGVAPDSSGFRGVTFSYIVRSDDRVDAVLAEAERVGWNDRQARAACAAGRLLRLLRGSRRVSLEGRHRHVRD
jgi:hypothetical protein